MEQNRDRTEFQPRHRGDHILPNTPFLAQLLRHAHKELLAIRDDSLAIERTYVQLLADALSLRNTIAAKLPHDALAHIDCGREAFIGILAAGGYEYAVAVIAIYALGAAVVPMTTLLPTQEAAYFVEKSHQLAIVASDEALKLAESTQVLLRRKTGLSVEVVEIRPNLSDGRQSPTDFLISSEKCLDENAAGLVIFTSGTTGPPKAVVHRRTFISEDTRATAEHFGITSSDVLLHVLPVHHATGAMINFFPFLSSGACIEFRAGSFDARWMWERWRQGGLTFFSGVPTIYMVFPVVVPGVSTYDDDAIHRRMMRYFEQHLSKLPMAEQDAYAEGANKIRVMMCGTSALPRPLQEFWTRIRQGKIIITRYGSTEVGAIFKVPVDPHGVPDGSVGILSPEADVRLSEGNEGEILVKSPFMFAKYLFDNNATAAAFDADGYFKTGDIAKRHGKYYTIIGRASQDIIKSGGYKISALDIERECLALPYIAEVMCVGVEDVEYGQRVGVVVSLRDDQDTYVPLERDGKSRLTIDTLRDDLNERLARYKMPTLLRVVEGELPKTASGKVLKKVLGPQFLPSPGWRDTFEVQAWWPKQEKRQSKL